MKPQTTAPFTTPETPTMTWAAIITALISTFGPILAEWLKNWLGHRLNQSALKLRAPDATTPPAQHYRALFDQTIDDLPRFAFARRTLLRRLRAVAVANAHTISNGTASLTPEEINDITDAAASAENE